MIEGVVWMKADTGSEDNGNLPAIVRGKAREVRFRSVPPSADKGGRVHQVLQLVVMGYGGRSVRGDLIYVELKGPWIRGTLNEGDYVEAVGLWSGETFQAEYILNYSRDGSRVAAVELPKPLKIAVTGLSTVFATMWMLFAAFLDPPFYSEYTGTFAGPRRSDRRALEHMLVRLACRRLG